MLFHYALQLLRVWSVFDCLFLEELSTEASTDSQTVSPDGNKENDKHKVRSRICESVTLLL